MAVDILRKQGCTDYMLIHDSFGVPANDAPKLNTAVREAFVTLFEGEPLKHWVSQVSPTHLKEAEDLMINTLDLPQVLESTYFFS
jgi:DNA-directed RNA polymerase